MTLEIERMGQMRVENSQDAENSKKEDNNFFSKKQHFDITNKLTNDKSYNYNQIVSPQVIYTYRRRREDIFENKDIFSDPCWDMLLTLFSSYLNKKSECISSVCISSNVPVTTALRWLKVLERQKLLARCNDPRDSRRIFIALTAEGVAKMYSALSINLFDKSHR
jgi:hypothetical protein